MDGKTIRLTIAGPADDPKNMTPGIRAFAEKVRDLLAEAGWDLQVTVWGGSGYDRVMLRMKRLCPEPVAEADLCLFLDPEHGDPFLAAEYSAAEALASAGGGPVAKKCPPEEEDACRSLMDALKELSPSLPVTIEEDGRVLVGDTEVLDEEAPYIPWFSFDEGSGSRCPECGGILRRYDDWFICESCNSIG